MADEAAKTQSQGEFILYTTLRTSIGFRALFQLVGQTCMTLRIIGVLASIYLFLMGLDMMGSSFLVLGGKGAGSGARC